MSRPRIALILTTYFEFSHADVLGTRLIEGYPWEGGEHTDPRVEVVSMYLEQDGVKNWGKPGNERDDIGREIAARAGIPIYPTPAEALGAGKPGINVDGVVIIGEHGDFELNEYEQKLYPRRRLFDAVVSAMIATDTFIPVFNDKHLAWSHTDARTMYDNAQRLGIGLGAGSTVPITWRVPQGTTWPMGEPMTEVAAAGYGSYEAYSYHAIEGMLSFAENRAGGETGVVAVEAFRDEAAVQALAEAPSAVVDAAIAAHGLDEAGVAEAKQKVWLLARITWADGLVGTLVMSSSLKSFSAAALGPQTSVSAELKLQGDPYSHFIHLARAAEHLMLTGEPMHPVERTLLAGGILDHALRSAAGAFTDPSVLADIQYSPNGRTEDTAIALPMDQIV